MSVDVLIMRKHVVVDVMYVCYIKCFQAIASVTKEQRLAVYAKHREDLSSDMWQSAADLRVF